MKEVTQEAFARFLTWLGPSVDVARDATNAFVGGAETAAARLVSREHRLPHGYLVVGSR